MRGTSVARSARWVTYTSDVLAILSPRTVEWHLGKVLGKLGISSRKELASALSDISANVVSA
jgi:DNA-binding CsgD family transcriptional regulator